MQRISKKKKLNFDTRLTCEKKSELKKKASVLEKKPTEPTTSCKESKSLKKTSKDMP
jgi:hypothetical protein